MNKFEKAWYIFSEIPVIFSMEFRIFRRTFLKLILDNVWTWIDNFKYQILTLLNQKVTDEK